MCVLRALTRQRHTLLRTRLFQMCGVDLTRIDGVDVTTALGAYFRRLSSRVDLTLAPSLPPPTNWPD